MSLQLLRNLSYKLPIGVQNAVLVRRRQPVWLDAGIVFIHIPKTAGTAINEAVYGRFMGHVRASDIERWGSPGLKALPRFAIVRNPWDRLVSAWRFVRRGGGIGGPHAGRIRDAKRYRVPEFETFDRFVREWLPARDPGKLDFVFQPQSPFVCDDSGEILVEHLGRFEQLDATYAFLKEKKPDLPPLTESNRSGAPVDYRSFYSAELVDLVASIYAEDLNRFGYRFE